MKLEKYSHDYSTLSNDELYRIIELKQYLRDINHKLNKDNIALFVRLINLKQNWIKKFPDGAEDLDLENMLN